MVIAQETLDWLNGVGVSSPRPDDLDLTYSFKHPLSNGKPSIAPRRPGTSLTWCVRFHTAQGQEPLTYPLMRTLIPNEALVGGGTGRVVMKVVIDVKKEFQNQGLATAVHSAEKLLCNRWGVRQMHMLAVGAGRLVWLKPKFGYIPKDPEPFLEAFDKWRVGAGYAADPGTDFSKYPKEFLVTVRELNLYQDVGVET